MLDAISRATGCAISPFEKRENYDWGLTGSHEIYPRIDELTYSVEVFSHAAQMPATVGRNVLTERATLLGLPPGGVTSANGKSRMVRAQDGWIAVNLPRATDVDLLPAWLGRDASADMWRGIEEVARTSSRLALVDRGRLLGLAVAPVDEGQKPSPLVTRMEAPRHKRWNRPLVIDLSSLWAGPLCGSLLADAGADVIKVESESRPDGARVGSPEFFARLNGKKRAMSIDPMRDQETLRALFATADVVIESARPRVLEQWGFSLREIFAANPSLIWVSVTAYGRDPIRGNWVGFGDDVAAAAGLVAESDGRPMFVGDAIADPLAGLSAAAATFACLAAGGGFLVDANLYAAAAFVANGRRPSP